MLTRIARKAQRAIFLLLAEQSIKKRAKVLLFFELTKFFLKKKQKNAKTTYFSAK